MSEIDSEILNGFLDESKTLVPGMFSILEGVEEDLSKKKTLVEYGNHVDRIMGGAKSLAMMVPEDHSLHFFADAAALCKAVSYKASKVANPNLIEISVALLLDVTEILSEMLEDIDQPMSVAKEKFSPHLIERLRWVSSQFDSNLSGSVEVQTAEEKSQNEIDDLLRKLGVIT